MLADSKQFHAKCIPTEKSIARKSVRYQVKIRSNLIPPSSIHSPVHKTLYGATSKGGTYQKRVRRDRQYPLWDCEQLGTKEESQQKGHRGARMGGAFYALLLQSKRARLCNGGDLRETTRGKEQRVKFNTKTQTTKAVSCSHFRLRSRPLPHRSFSCPRSACSLWTFHPLRRCTCHRR